MIDGDYSHAGAVFLELSKMIPLVEELHLKDYILRIRETRNAFQHYENLKVITIGQIDEKSKVFLANYHPQMIVKLEKTATPTPQSAWWLPL